VVTDELAGARLDPEAVLRTALSTLSKLRPVTWVAALMSKDPRNVLVVAADEDDPPLAKYVEGMELSGNSTPTTGFTLRVIETGVPILVPQVPYKEFVAMQTPASVEHLERHQLPLNAPITRMGCVVVPMRTRGSTIGTLGIFDRQSLKPMTSRDVEWLQEIADRIAVPVENAQMHVIAKSRLDRITGLRHVALAIAGSRDLRLTLQVILDQAVNGLVVDAADLLLLDEADSMLRTVASTGFQTTSIPEYRLPVQVELPGDALLGIAGGSNGTPTDDRRGTLFAREGFKSRRAVPLVAHGKLMGVLEVFSRSQLQPDQEWLDFLEALASEAAVAVDIAGSAVQVEKRATGFAARRAAHPDFSRLENEILALVVEGLSNPEIADKMHLSQHTIKFHVRRILQKVGAVNRTELARKATKEGWL
jgi:DNA-binding CsgD family transcriptional regulator/GAF domain-containing protein